MKLKPLLLLLATSTAFADQKPPPNVTWIGPVDPDGPDCSGDCHFNQYTLDIKYPLS